MGVTATVVVKFEGAGGDGQLTAELDTRPDGYNGGRSVFAAGDEPVFLVRKSANVTVTAKTSLGNCASFATGVTQEQESLTFMDAKSANLSKPAKSGLTSSEWMGNDLGLIRLVNQNEVVLQGDPVGAGVLQVEYESAYTAYRLTGIPATVNGKKNFEVLVGFIGVVEDAG